jgi:hypothetical protein
MTRTGPISVLITRPTPIPCSRSSRSNDLMRSPSNTWVDHVQGEGNCCALLLWITCGSLSGREDFDVLLYCEVEGQRQQECAKTPAANVLPDLSKVATKNCSRPSISMQDRRTPAGSSRPRCQNDRRLGDAPNSRQDSHKAPLHNRPDYASYPALQLGSRREDRRRRRRSHCRQSHHREHQVRFRNRGSQRRLWLVLR